MIPAWLAASLIPSILVGARIPTPEEHLGFTVCQDYHLANYTQLSGYWRLLEQTSDRVKLVTIGKTEDGRDQLMCVVSDPANLRRLASIRSDNSKIARATLKSDQEARAFVKDKKAVVWIDGGLHASEVLVAQHLIEQAYRLASAQDEETKRILKDCVVLLVHANPDGNEWVADHYMRREEPTTRSVAGLPFLYQKYCGHDNNRDFYANNMAETVNMNRVLYKDWYPQIVYNHHQSAPAGTIMFAPPFRNPFNYNIDPLTHISTEAAGTAIHQRLISEGKAGSAMRGSTLYSTWWNGGLRTTTYFHNMIGILTETFGSPNPGPLPFSPRFQVPSTDVPMPVTAGTVWHLRDSLEYEVSANMALLDFASRNRETLLFNMYKAGRNSIERGLTDTWSRYPSRLAEFREDALRKPEFRDPKAYVVPLDLGNQPDPGAARAFLTKLVQCGIEIEELQADSGAFKAGSIVVRCAQPFRPHILDMFEPQDHPNDFQYEGGPPVPPYDNAGYTLALQMGVKFERLLDLPPLKTRVVTAVPDFSGGRTSGAIQLPRSQGLSYAVANDALAVGSEVSLSDQWITLKGKPEDLASIVRARPQAAFVPSTNDEGLSVPRKPRIALWDRYGGSMESGWTRFVLERYGFVFEVVYPPDIDGGALAGKYDLLILPSGAVSAGRRGGGQPGETGEAPEDMALLQQNFQDDPTIPEVWRRRMGQIGEGTLNEIKRFAEGGGHVLAIGSSCLPLSRSLGLPVRDALVAVNGQRLATRDFYVPGSLLEIALSDSFLTKGMGANAIVMFDESPAFLAESGSVAGYASEKTLRSGWAWGQNLLNGSSALVDLPVGEGRVVLCGPEILFRGQPHGTFRLLFNAAFRAVSARGAP